MVKKIILFGTASVFCLMFITYSCNNTQNPVKNTGGNGNGGGTTLISTTNPFITDPSLPPPALDSTLLEWDGTTTVEPTLVGNVYEVENANEFAWIATQTSDFTGKTIKLMENINMNDKPFNGIASLAGTLDGNSKIIHKINISKNLLNGVGLVSSLKTGGVIKDLTISEGSVSGAGGTGGVVGISSGANTMISNVANYGVSVTAVGNFVGGIIGNSANHITIVNVVNSGDVTGGGYIGGIIGACGNNYIANITKVRNAGTVSGGVYIGGIVGASSGAIIKDAGNSGNVSGSGDGIGGIIGIVFNDTTTTIDDSYNYVSVTASGNIDELGGIVGAIYNATAILEINNSYYVTTTYDAIGKIDSTTPPIDNSIEISLAEFSTQSTFTGWDFSNTWSMGTLHPILK